MSESDRSRSGPPRPRPIPRMPPMRTPPSPSGCREPARNQYSGSGWGAVLFWILVGTAAVAASAATFLLVSAPIDLVRERIAEQVKARTGRELTVAGATSFSLLPTFSVSVGGVSLSPPPGMSGAPVFRVDSVEARVPLLPLLMRDVQLERIVLKGPEIELRVDAQGRRSWDFKQAEERPSSARPGEAKVADPARQTALDRLSRAELRIEGGQLRYIDERKNTQEQVSDIDLRIALERADAPLTVVR